MKGFIAYFLVAGFLLQSCTKIDPQEEKSLFDSFAEHLKQSRAGEPESAIQVDIIRGLGVDFKEHCEKTIREIGIEKELTHLDQKANTDKGRSDIWLRHRGNRLFFEIKRIKPNVGGLNELVKDIIRCATFYNSRNIDAAYFMGIAENASLRETFGRGYRSGVENILHLPVSKDETITNWLSTFKPEDTSTKDTIKDAKDVFSDIEANCVYRKKLNKDLELLLWRFKGNLKKNPLESNNNNNNNNVGLQDERSLTLQSLPPISSANTAASQLPYSNYGETQSSNGQGYMSTSLSSSSINNNANSYLAANSSLSPRSNYPRRGEPTINNNNSNSNNSVPQNERSLNLQSPPPISLANATYSSQSRNNRMNNSSQASQPNRSIFNFFGGNFAAAAESSLLSNSNPSNSNNSNLPSFQQFESHIGGGQVDFNTENQQDKFNKRQKSSDTNSDDRSAKKEAQILFKAREDNNGIFFDLKPYKDKNIRNEYSCWTVCINGPVNTAYEEGIFSIYIFIPDDYPSKSPELRFITPIYHPNISKDKGCVGLSYLNDLNYRDSGRVVLQVIGDIYQLLMEPDLSSNILNEEAARLYKTDRVKFEAIAKEWTSK